MAPYDAMKDEKYRIISIPQWKGAIDRELIVETGNFVFTNSECVHQYKWIYESSYIRTAEHCTGIAVVMGSNPVQAFNFTAAA